MPKPLHFRKPSVDPILAGKKRATVRKAGSGYRRGDIVKAVLRRQPAFADLWIDRVQTVALDDLTPTHARAEGEPDVDSLRTSIRRLYPEQQEFDVISFHVV